MAFFFSSSLYLGKKLYEIPESVSCPLLYKNKFITSKFTLSLFYLFTYELKLKVKIILKNLAQKVVDIFNNNKEIEESRPVNVQFVVVVSI